MKHGTRLSRLIHALIKFTTKLPALISREITPAASRNEDMTAKVRHFPRSRAIYTEIVFARGTIDADKTRSSPVSNFGSEAERKMRK